MSEVKISVIVPIYNVEKYIAETVNSLKQQVMSSVEFIMVDDGSTDRSFEILVKTTKDDSRFKIVKQPNKGVSSARNLGIEISIGNYITFLDSDDLLLSESLIKLYAAAINDSADLVYGRIKRFDGKKSWYVNAHVDSELNKPGEKDIIDNSGLFFSIGPCAKLYERKLLEAVSFPENIVFGEDQVVSFFAYINAKKIVCIDNDVYMYRVRETGDSITQRRKDLSIEYLKDIIEVVKDNESVILKSSKYTYEEKNKILSSYYERVIRFEIYPLFRSSLRKIRMQENVLKMIVSWLGTISDDIKKVTPGIFELFLVDLNNYLFIISYKNKKYLHEIQEILLTEEQAFIDKNIQSYEKDINFQRKFISSSLYSSWYYKIISLYRFTNKKTGVNNKLLFIIFQISKLLPIKNNLVIISSSKEIKENDDLFYIYNKIKNKTIADVRSVSSFNQGFKKNIRKYLLLAKAKVIIVDDYFYPLYNKKIKKKQYYIQMWHASGAYKKFAYSALNSLESTSEKFEYRAHHQYTHVIASSRDVAEIYSEAFNLPNHKIIPNGFPRTDCLFDKNYEAKIKKKFYEIYPKLKEEKLILYAPTFRGSAKERGTFKAEIDWDKVTLPSKTTILTKYHPIVKKMPSKDSRYILDVTMDSNFSIIDYMIISDVLITDYSSIIFEYSLLNKPLINYFSDFEEYQKERGFFYPIEKYTYDLMATNEEELSEQIKEVIFKGRKIKFRKDFHDKFMGSCDGESTKRLLELIESLLE